MEAFKFHHAPWSKRFKTFFFKGQYAYELQIGPLVFQWFYVPYKGDKYNELFHKGRLLIWKDDYWNRWSAKKAMKKR